MAQTLCKKCILQIFFVLQQKEHLSSYLNHLSILYVCLDLIFVYSFKIRMLISMIIHQSIHSYFSNERVLEPFNLSEYDERHCRKHY